MQSSQTSDDNITGKLVTAARSLAEAFFRWSDHSASENEVSDCYVNLGNLYVEARTLLTNAGINCDDLIDVPLRLRQTLEEALAMTPSKEIYDKYEPEIRAVMMQLFHEVKTKQTRSHSRKKSSSHNSLQNSRNGTPSAKEYVQPNPQEPQQSHAKNKPVPRGVPNPHPQIQVPQQKQQQSHQQRQQYEHNSQIYAQHPQNKGPMNVQNSDSHFSYSNPHITPYVVPVPHTQAVKGSTGSANSSRRPSNGFHHSDNSAMSSNMYASAHRSEKGLSNDNLSQTNGSNDPNAAKVIPRPKRVPDTRQTLKPPTNDVLIKLQQHGALERQASKRYSTQQLSSIVHGSPVQSSILPTTLVNRRSGVPDFRDSNVIPRRVSETVSKPHEQDRSESTTAESLKSVTPIPIITTSRAPTPQAQISSEDQSDLKSPFEKTVSSPDSGNQPDSKSSVDTERNSSYPNEDENANSNSESHESYENLPGYGSSSPVLEKKNTFSVFLRIGSMIRKAKVSKPPSMAAIRLLFIEVCEYVHSESGTFPAIDIQDPESKIDYELTEQTVNDIQEGQLLTLKVKTPDEIRIDEELKDIKNTIKTLVEKLENKKSVPGTPSVGTNGNGIPSSNNNARVLSPSGSSSPFGIGKFKSKDNSISDEKSEMIKRELAVIRQITSKTVGNMRQEISTLRQELKQLSSATPISDRGFIDKAKAKLDFEKGELIVKIDALSDIIDEQRISVGTKGVRYPKHEMDKVRKELNSCFKMYEKAQQFLNKEKLVWKKIWQQELSTVIEEQEWLKKIDMLFKDMKSDFKQTMDTFELVNEANDLPPPVSKGTLPLAPPIKPGEEQAVANAMLEEISALNYTSENRALAVERAERIHKAKLALKSEEFEDELGSFVADSKLKHNGGFEEVERRRLERDLLSRKNAEESELEAIKLHEKVKAERKAQRAKERTKAKLNESNDLPQLGSDASATSDDTHKTTEISEVPDSQRAKDSPELDAQQSHNSANTSMNQTSPVHELKNDEPVAQVISAESETSAAITVQDEKQPIDLVNDEIKESPNKRESSSSEPMHVQPSAQSSEKEEVSETSEKDFS